LFFNVLRLLEGLLAPDRARFVGFPDRAIWRSLTEVSNIVNETAGFRGKRSILLSPEPENYFFPAEVFAGAGGMAGIAAAAAG
jgi:hypothetical protein